MKTKHYYLLSLLSLLIGLISVQTFLYASDSRNGDGILPRGQYRLLIVFSEITGDPDGDLATSSWPVGQLPTKAGEIFNVDGPLQHYEDQIVLQRGPSDKVTYKGQITKNISKFFYDASFGELVLLADYYPRLISIPYSQIDEYNDGWRHVLDSLVSDGAMLSKSGLRIPEDFDHWSAISDELTIPEPDGKIDLIVIIWRVNSQFMAKDESGTAGSSITSTDGTISTNNTIIIRSSDFYNTTIIPHEISHYLLGGNNFHNGGRGAGRSNFLADLGGYGILESYNSNLRSCNAWDRMYLGWKSEQNAPTIHAKDLSGNLINSDLVYNIPTSQTLQGSYSPTYQDIVLRDFISSGDALRIKLPYTEQGGSNVKHQWIWVENHAKDGEMVYSLDGHYNGVRVNIQVGNEPVNNNKVSSRTNYYAPFNSFGRWDFDIVSTGGVNKAYSKTETENPFCGSSLSEYMVSNYNGDNIIQPTEAWIIKDVYHNSQKIDNDYPILGSVYDCFGVGKEISISSNPSTASWLTHESVSGSSTLTFPTSDDSRQIYLNGIKIRVQEKKSDSSVVIRVYQGYYNIDKKQRWCGNIVLNEKINMLYGKNIDLSLSNTPTETSNPLPIRLPYSSAVIEYPVPSKNMIYSPYHKDLFTKPTTLTCKSGSVISFSGSNTITIDSLCALVMQAGSHIKKNSASGGNLNINVKKGGSLVIPDGVTIPSSVVINIESGAYACIDYNNSGNKAFYIGEGISGVHPKIEAYGVGYCEDNTVKLSSVVPKADSSTVYKSFFEGNPVYYQGWETFGSDMGKEAVRINRHSIMGDTMIDGKVYNKLGIATYKFGNNYTNGGSYTILLRESEDHSKIWMRTLDDMIGSESLVVDLNLKVGDTFRLCNCGDIDSLSVYKVDSVYYKEHEGGILKHIRFEKNKRGGGYKNAGCVPSLMAGNGVEFGRCDYKDYQFEFIEGIGSNLGFAYMRLGDETHPLSFIDGSMFIRPSLLRDYIVCVEKDSTLFYKHPQPFPKCFDCDSTEIYYARTMNEKTDYVSGLNIYPVPSTDNVTIDVDKVTIGEKYNLELYNMQGKMIIEKNSITLPYSLDIRNLVAGMYMLKIRGVNSSAEKFYIGKIIVRR